MQYRNDDSLAFLQFCTNGELCSLVDLFIKEPTEHLTKEYKYQKYAPDHSQYWELIGAELQHFGGNTVSNRLRQCGVSYKEILWDVCKHLGVKCDQAADPATIERVLFYELIEQKISTLNRADRRTFAKKMGIDEPEISALNLGLKAREQFFWHKKLRFDWMGYINPLSSKSILRNGVSFLGDILIKKVIGGVLSGSFIPLHQISGPALRVTVPAVIHIAYLREKYRKQDQKIRKRFYLKKGAILRTDLIGGVLDHSGIYIDDNQIIEIVNRKGRAEVRKTDLYNFVFQGTVRTGSAIYTATDLLSKEIICEERIAMNAKKMLGMSKEYQLRKDNCHTFVHRCITGLDFNAETDVYKFQDLTDLISWNLNQNRRVKWEVCDVNPKEKGFD